MRVFNTTDLHADIDLHLSAFFRQSGGDNSYAGRVNARERKYMEWIKKAWVRHFMKQEAAMAGFLYDVRVRRMPSMFKSESSSAALKLEVQTPLELLMLDPQTEWDVKDADAGTLFYYSPGKFTLERFYHEVNDVRDYVLDLLSNDPEIDLSKRSYPDMKRASETWHVEQQRLLQARMEAEAALRRAADASRAMPAWDHLSEGRDWDLAMTVPFELNGMKFLALRLKSQQALDFESYIMEHCVHSYGPRLRTPDPLCVILSIRALDSAHLPLVTAELSVSATGSYAPFYIQIRGKHNHDAEQTIKGISKKLQELIGSFTKETLSPISGDLNYVISGSRA